MSEVHREDIQEAAPGLSETEEMLTKINILLAEHGLVVKDKYTGGLCGLEGTYTCWIEKVEPEP